MYIMTLEINQKCNLKCRYCYLGEKDGSKMSINTAFKAIDLAFEKVKIHKDKKIWFDFVGGEALLDFKMIEKLVNYIEMKNQKVQNILQFSVTTNATIISQEIIDFLVNKKFSLKVSIDGNKVINDLNRLSKDGYSVHDKIVSNLNQLREFERRSNKIVQVTNVVTNNNYRYYAESIKYLVEDLGFKLIDTAIDYCTEWSGEEKVILEKEIRKAFEYFIECAKQGKGFRWSFVDSLVDMKKERKKFYSCGAGIVSVYVRCDGSLYACPANLNEEVKLGHIDTGFINEKINWLKCFDNIENEKCQSCIASKYCPEKSCVMINISKTGTPHEPDPMLCWNRMLMYRMYLENEKIISKIEM